MKSSEKEVDKQKQNQWNNTRHERTKKLNDLQIRKKKMIRGIPEWNKTEENSKHGNRKE